MQLHEAIALGRVMIKHRGGRIIQVAADSEVSGCALGMAAVGAGVGCKFRQLAEAWPVLHKIVTAPCECFVWDITIADAVAHLFDGHVMLVGDWTLDHLIDWVREVEGEEPPAATGPIAAESVEVAVAV